MARVKEIDQGGLFVARNDHQSTLHVGLSSSDDDGEHVVQLVLKNRRHRNRHVCQRLPEQVQTLPESVHVQHHYNRPITVATVMNATWTHIRAGILFRRPGAGLRLGFVLLRATTPSQSTHNAINGRNGYECHVDTHPSWFLLRRLGAGLRLGFLFLRATFDP